MEGCEAVFKDQVTLPSYEEIANKEIEYVDRVFLKASRAIAETLLSSKEQLSFESASKFLENSFRDGHTFLESGLFAMFSHQGLFLKENVSQLASKQYAKHLSEIFSEAYQKATSPEEKLELATSLWVLASPLSLLYSASMILFQSQPKRGDLFLERLSYLIEDRYRLDLSYTKEIEKLYLIQPLLRPLEYEARSLILTQLIEFEREDLTKKDMGLWLDFAETISSISSNIGISYLKAAYEFGKKESPEIFKVVQALEKVKGDQIKEDSIYQEFVSYQMEEIARRILRFKTSLSALKTEEALFSKIDELKHEVILKLNLMISAGSSIFLSQSLKKRLQLSFIELVSEHRDSFENLTLSAILPIGVLNIEEALTLGDQTNFNDAQEPHFKYIELLEKLAEYLKANISFDLEESFFDRLLVVLGSPLRIYNMLEFEEVTLNLLKDTSEADLSILETNALLQHLLLERETIFYNKFLAFRSGLKQAKN